MARHNQTKSTDRDHALTLLVAAGGTAGHLFPARALAEELAGKDTHIHLVTDRRGAGFDQGFPAEKIHMIKAATPVGCSPLRAGRALFTLGFGVITALALIRRTRPHIVVGFGGYPTVAPLVAAWLARVPVIIHDQNAVMGRANRLLVRFAEVFATSVPTPRLASPAALAKAVHTGNPVRRAVLEVRDQEYLPPQPPSGSASRLRLVVFGGSQGAGVFATMVPKALARFAPNQRRRITLVAQCRRGDEAALGAAYEKIGIKAQVAPFFTDMPRHIAKAHLVICRAGASTTTELAVIGRPAIMVPLPGAIDQDQRWNAQELAVVGGGWLVEEKNFDEELLAMKIKTLWQNPKVLAEAAAAARAIGRPNAAVALGALVRHVAARRALGTFQV
ncbi:MAG: undecaprenyldiphospho-muramoylpentapeptide beta-N-acetylglucosaminyltransferase [Alphaproteobacteria bacterium]